MSLFKCLSKNVSLVREQEDKPKQRKIGLTFKHMKGQSEDKRQCTAGGTEPTLEFIFSNGEDNFLPTHSSLNQDDVAIDNQQPSPSDRTINYGSASTRICFEKHSSQPDTVSLPASESVTKPICTDNTNSDPTVRMLRENISFNAAENAATSNTLYEEDIQRENIAGTLNKNISIGLQQKSDLSSTQLICSGDTISDPNYRLRILNEHIRLNGTKSATTNSSVCKDDSHTGSISETLNNCLIISQNSETGVSNNSSLFANMAVSGDDKISNPTSELRMLRECISLNTTENTAISCTVCEDNSQTESISETLNKGFNVTTNSETARSKKAGRCCTIQ